MIKDVWIFNTSDGGNITETLSIRDGLESSVYLSLFGGNIDDDGSEKSNRNWWGNLNENNESRIYRATTAHLLATTTPTPSNLRRIEDSAKQDLAWMITEKIAERIEVKATMPARNNVDLSVRIDGIDSFKFNSRWSDLLENVIFGSEESSGGGGGTSALPLAAFLDDATIAGRTAPSINVVMIDEENPTAQMRVDGLQIKGTAQPFATITVEI